MSQEMTLDDVYRMFGEAGSAKELFYDWMGANNWLFVQINQLRAGWYDHFMQMVTELGDKYNFPIFLLLLAAWAIGSAFLRKLRGKGGARHYFIMWLGIFCVLMGGFAVNAFVVNEAKGYFSYPRPYVALSRDKNYANEKIYVLEQREEPMDDYRSFPSGHAAIITLLIVGLWPALTPRAQAIGAMLVALVGWSRVSLGMHFPADVVGSIILTLLLTILVRAIIYTLLRRIGLNC